MKQFAAVLSAVLVAIPLIARSEDSVLLAQAHSNKFVNAEVPCPEDLVCMDAWFRWELSVKRLVNGPFVPEQITAVWLQHSEWRIAPNEIGLAVVEPIADPTVRRKLGADYWLRELEFPSSMYCISKSPESYGLDVDPDAVSQTPDGELSCFHTRELEVEP